MTLIIGKNSIEEKVKQERLQRAETRRQIDQIEGKSRGKGPQRGDFKICREGDKILNEYKHHKNPEDRKKINQEYFQMQKEMRR